MSRRKKKMKPWRCPKCGRVFNGKWERKHHRNMKSRSVCTRM